MPRLSKLNGKGQLISSVVERTSNGQVLDIRDKFITETYPYRYYRKLFSVFKEIKHSELVNEELKVYKYMDSVFIRNLINYYFLK